ncbi:MAG: hypothetical protein Q4C20_00945 [Erysipelotrichaceae bacterium]|nr:hypothetical protein [Erysipelotrichaceae bacterium]
MKILIMTGPLYPVTGNNANLIGKLIPSLLETKHEVRQFSGCFGIDQSSLPSSLFDVPVYWANDDRKDIKRRVLYPLLSKLVDPNGFSDELQVQIYSSKLSEIRKEYPFDTVISTCEPYSMAVCASRIKEVRKILYLMDPPAVISNGIKTKYRTNTLNKTLINQDAIISTPFIFEALKKHGIDLNEVNEISVGFPMINKHGPGSMYQQKKRIKLLFTGWLYSDIRSPEYFLKIVEKLDDRFQITFMGKECEYLKERFSIESRAEIITLPQQPYEAALQAMADSDILINIGNSVPVHMPSKTLEYINTGKPVVNFFKFEDCPTLYYTRRYPLALNLYEGDPDINKAADRFIQFCESTKGQVVDRKYILDEFKDCTPEYIANRILDVLEK